MTNNYDYPADPINGYDLTGLRQDCGTAACNAKYYSTQTQRQIGGAQLHASPAPSLPPKPTVLNPNLVAGVINVLWGGTQKVITGLGQIASASVAEATVAGIPIGITVEMLGVFNFVTGAFRVARGARQLSFGLENPLVKMDYWPWTLSTAGKLLPGGGPLAGLVGWVLMTSTPTGPPIGGPPGFVGPICARAIAVGGDPGRRGRVDSFAVLASGLGSLGQFLGWVDLNLVAFLQRGVFGWLIRVPSVGFVPWREIPEVSHRVSSNDLW